MKRFPIAVIAVIAILFTATVAHAKWPRISPIPDIWINMNDSSALIRFTVSDNETSAGDLVITYKSSNKSLIPEDDDHITLGGWGGDRTLVVTPEHDKWGYADITIFVTDNDGDVAQEGFQVRVDRPANLSLKTSAPR